MIVATSLASYSHTIEGIQNLLPSIPKQAYELANSFLTDHASELTATQITRLLLLQTSALLRAGDLDTGERLLSELKDRISYSHDDYDACEFISLNGYLLFHQQKFTESNKLLLEAYDNFRRLGDSKDRERAVFSNILWLSHSYTTLSKLVKALEHLLEGLEYAKVHGLTYNIAARHTDLGTIYLMLEQYEKAIEVFEQALQLIEGGDEDTPTEILTSIAVCHFHLRNIGKCLQHSETILTRRNTKRNAHSTALTLLAYCYIQRNDLQRAEDLLKDNESRFELVGLRKILQALVYGQLFHKQGDYASAIGRLEAALYQSREQKLIRYEHRAALELAALYITVGNESKALQCYRDLYDLHYHAFLAQQIGEVNRMLSDEHGSRYFIYVEPDQKDEDQSESQELLLQLTEVSLELNQKRRYLQQILSSLTSLPHLKASILRKEVESLQSGIKSQLTATVSWDSLDQKLMRLAGPDFQRAVLKRGPTLTPTELRVCALIRCDLSTKEIAQMLGTSIRTIDTHRTRIRKKLGLDGSANLYTHLMEVQ